jgi:hypothetical protein
MTKMMVEYDRNNKPTRLVWLDTATGRVVGYTLWASLLEKTREACLEGKFPV